jgi:Cu2+-exporting ATPase
VTISTGIPERLAPGLSRAACAHCGADLAPGQGEFCCTGCAGAHALVRGLGLDAFYRRQETAAGTLRPPEALTADFAPLARPARNGTMELDLIVSGLTCGACVWLVEQALAAEPDVLKARASLTTRRLAIAWRGDAARAQDLAALVARLGFKVAPWSPACLRATEDAEGRALVRALGIAAFGSMNVMLVSVAVWVGDDMEPATRHLMHWLAALVALPTVLVAGMPFYRSAWDAIRAGRVNMDLAVSIGVIATTLMSLSETLRNGDYTWFDGATSLLALLLAGRVMDRAMRRRARQAVAELLALQEGQRRPAACPTAPPQRAGREREARRRVLVAPVRAARLTDGGDTVDPRHGDTTGESIPRELAGRRGAARRRGQHGLALRAAPHRGRAGRLALAQLARAAGAGGAAAAETLRLHRRRCGALKCRSWHSLPRRPSRLGARGLRRLRQAALVPAVAA